LLSGGLDSTTTLAIAQAEGHAVHALTFRYGQRHDIEVAAAQRIAVHCKVAGHVVVPIDLRIFGGSALTSDTAVPKDRSADDMGHGIPITYVPARNTIFLSFALAFAEVLDTGHIFLGVNVLDASGYPDCRPEYIEAFERMANLATRIGVEGRQGPEPMAVLLLRDPSGDAAAAVAEANRELGTHQQIRRWLIWPEADFPRTSTQKVRKPAIANWIRSQTQGAETNASGVGQQGVPLTLAALLGKVSGEAPRALDPSLRLDSDLKLDSLGRVELLSLLEDHYQVELDEARMTAATTLGDVEEQLKAQWVQQQTEVAESTSSGAGNLDHEASAEARSRVPAPSVQVRSGQPHPYPRWPLGSMMRGVRAGLFQCLILPLARLLSRIEVSGLEHLEGLKEPTLFVANHVTHADPGLILAALPRRFRHRIVIAMDGERLRSWCYPDLDQGFVRRVGLIGVYYLALLTFNVFPLPRRSGFRRSFAFAGRAMDRGYHVLVFPEGRLTEDGEMQPFRRGAGLLAAGLNAPVVPVKLGGLFELRQRPKRSLWAFMLRPGKISVTVGSALRFGTDEDAGTITMKLEQAVAALGASRGWA
jgi:long-chain acyl-CoA synthetase